MSTDTVQGAVANFMAAADVKTSRYKSKAELEKEKQLKYEAKQKAKYEAVWGWRDDGLRMKAKLDKQFSRVEGILGPHQRKKECMQYFDLRCKDAIQTKNKFNRPHSQWLLRRIISHQSPDRVALSLVVRRFWNVLYEIRKTDKTEYDALKPIERSLVRFIKLKVTTVMELRGLRMNVGIAQDELDLVLRTIAACEGMVVCKSIQHSKPAGCPICKGIVGRLGLTVISVHRVSGAETLLPWEIEMKNLGEERIAKQGNLDAAVKELEAYEVILRHRVVCAIQRWWCIYLVRKKTKNKKAKVAHSLFYYNIRRLVVIKRRIDFEMSNNSLDMEKMREDYADFNFEISEYIASIAHKHQARIDKVARKFLNNLRAAVLKTRKLKHQRAMMVEREKARAAKLASKLKTERSLADMRIRVKALEARNLVCLRPECNYREFASQDRYDTHMSLHYMRDEEDTLRRKANALAWRNRDVVTNKFVNNIKKARDAIYSVEHFEAAEAAKQMKLLQLEQEARDTGGTMGLGDGFDDLTHDGTVDMNTLGKLDMNMTAEQAQHARETNDLSFGGGFGDDGGADGEHDQITIGTGGLASGHDDGDEDVDNGNDEEKDADMGDLAKGGLLDFDSTTEANDNNATDNEAANVSGQEGEESGPSPSRSGPATPAKLTRADIAGVSQTLSEREAGMLQDSQSIGSNFTVRQPHGNWGILGLVKDRVGMEELSLVSVSSPASRAGGSRGSSRQSKSRQGTGTGTGAGDDDSTVVSSVKIPAAELTEAQQKELDRAEIRRREKDDGVFIFEEPAVPAVFLETSPLPWLRHTHFKQISADLHMPLHHLELLSKHGDMDCPPRIALDKPVVRFGSLEGIEAVLKTHGECRKYAMVSKIHCLVNVPMARCDGPVTVVDNSSLWGTYLVTAKGAHKVPNKISAGRPMQSGDLLCIGVRPRGPQELSPDIAGQACCVYRVRCLAVESVSLSSGKGGGH